MSQSISGKKVAILATDGFEQSELFEPLKALQEAGAEVDIVSLKTGSIKAWDKDNWGKTIEATVAVADADPADYDALVLPGGQINPDKLRVDEDAVAFAKSFMQDAKPVAAICHGPWTLIETGLVKGRKMTSYKSIKTDLKNAGVMWEDSEVVTDNGLVTSRDPNDLPAFCAKMIEEIREGKHDRRKTTASAAAM